MFIVSSHSGKASGKRDQANKKGLELCWVPTQSLCYYNQAIGLIYQPKACPMPLKSGRGDQSNYYRDTRRMVCLRSVVKLALYA